MYCFVIGLRHTLLITQRFSSWFIWDVSTILENNCSSSCDIKNYNVRLCLHPYIFLITCHHSGLPLQCGMYPTHSARCVNGSLRRENGRKVTLHVHASSHIHPCQFAYDQLTGSNKSIVNNITVRFLQTLSELSCPNWTQSPPKYNSWRQLYH